MTYFKQTEEKYKSIKLGNGEGSIYAFGCYMISLCNGLQAKGYSYDPEQLNNILKVKNLWTGTTKNLIDVANIVSRWFDVFTSFKRVDPWTFSPTLDEILQPDTIAIGEVDAAGIGGSSKGQHFVLITKKATNGHAIIYDPWRGIEEIIDTHWASLGYIKSLRLFTVKPHVNEPAPAPQPVITDQTRIPQIDNMEVQAIRSERNDNLAFIERQHQEILSLEKKLEIIKTIVNG